MAWSCFTFSSENYSHKISESITQREGKTTSCLCSFEYATLGFPFTVDISAIPLIILFVGRGYALCYEVNYDDIHLPASFDCAQGRL